MQACPAALYYMYKIVEHCKYDDLFWNGKRKNGNFFKVSAS